MPEIALLTADDIRANVDELADLLTSVVDDGASVGFMAPMPLAEAVQWWHERAQATHLRIWAAFDGPRITGTISLEPGLKPNGRHRAEVTKLMVHGDSRGQGLGRKLLAVAEESAAESGLILLYLDTETGSAAQRLYESAGWTQAGVIPDYALTPQGVLHPTTLFYKKLARIRQVEMV